MTSIRRFKPGDADSVFQLMEDEGSEWAEYYGESGRHVYLAALNEGIAYVATDGETVLGYIRCNEDYGFGIYVYDLLVGKPFRGRQLGRKLMEQVTGDYAGQPIYVMSDADPYYIKLGYKKIGSIFQAGNHTVD